MALSETPSNPFATGEVEGNIREEKIEVLRMLAEHGTRGYKIYDDARTSLAAQEELTTDRIDSGRTRFAPVALLQGLADRHNAVLRGAMNAVQNLRRAEEGFFGEVTSSAGEVMDMAIADRSGARQYDQDLESFLSRGRELESNTRPYDLRARRPERTGGGGGGRGSGSGFVNNRPVTIPLDLLNRFSGVDLASRSRGVARGRAFSAANNRARGRTRTPAPRYLPRRSTSSRSSGTWGEPIVKVTGPR